MGNSKTNPINYLNKVVENNKKLRARNEYLESIHENANKAISSRDKLIKDLESSVASLNNDYQSLLNAIPFFVKWFVPKRLKR